MSIAIPSLRGAIAVPSWAKNDLWRRARAVPSLDLRFAESKSLIDAVSGQQLITFSRASGGAVVNSAGQIEIVAANVPRFTHDPVTLESLGLLVEEQRTQLLELTDTLATQTKTVAAVAHTLSFYGTGTVALSGAHSATVVGTGAYPARRTLTFTPTAGSLTLTVTGTVQFGQLEAGLFATSYIPNAGTGQVNRSADVASITGANFSSWYRQNEGTGYTECAIALPASSGNQFVFRASDNSYNNSVAWNIQLSGFASMATAAGGVFDGIASSSSALTANQAAKFAAGYQANNLALSLSGAATVIDTSATMPTALTRADIGSDHLGNNRIRAGTIRRLTYWPQRLPNSTLQNITL
jgi:hypothetical protein